MSGRNIDDSSFENEIVRIQQEIDDVLHTEPETKEPDQDFVFVEDKDEKTIECTLEPEEPKEEAPIISRDVYYHETIKNETHKKEKSKFKKIVALVCVASVIGGGCIGLGLAAGTYVINQTFNKPAETTEALEKAEFTFVDQTVKADSYTERPTQGYAALIKQVEPSVVTISSAIAQTQVDFFGGYMIPQPDSSKGTGIIFHEDSEKVYIATNYHVVSGANGVQVSITGKDEVSAKLVGKQPQSDLAVLSVEKEDLKKVGITSVTLAVFGDSDKMEVGEFVLAIGNAMGGGNTATEGIVSAKNKEINVEDTNLTVIQTDAAINPGNSGGPLINLRGEVIGINTAKLSSASGIEGMGYSITSNIAKPIIEDLMNSKAKPFLGVRGENITEETARMYQLPQMGALIVEVVAGSSAEAAGVKRADIIIGFNDEPILSMEQLSEAISECQIGDEVKLKLLRGGTKAIELTAVLSEYSDTEF